ncbi:MAG: DMT family transporter [Steroidobacteraceae bacterium]
MSQTGIDGSSLRGSAAPALFALLVGALAIASSGIFVRLADTGPIATAFWRVAISVPVFGVVLLWQRHRARDGTTNFRYERGFLWCGLALAADLIFWHWALIATSIALATLEGNMTPVFVALASWWIYRQRPDPKLWLAILVAMCGLVLLVLPRLEAGLGNLRGDLYGVITAVFYAAYLFIVADLRRRHATAVLMFWTALVTAVLLFIPAHIEGLLPHSAHGWRMVIGLALMSQCLGQGLIAYALQQLPATFGSIGLYLQPVAAAAFAWWFLGEQLHPVQFAGAAVVFAAIAIARAATRDAARRQRV